MTDNERNALTQIANMTISFHGLGEPCQAEEMYKIIDEAMKLEKAEDGVSTTILWDVFPRGDSGRSCPESEIIYNAKKLLASERTMK